MRNVIKNLVLSAVPPVQRLQQNRDNLVDANQRLLREKQELQAENKILRSEILLSQLRHRPSENYAGGTSTSSQSATHLTDGFYFRLAEAYRAAVINAPTDPTPSMWSGDLTNLKYREHMVMLRGTIAEIRDLLQNPTKTQLCYGFDELMIGSEGRDDPASVLVKTSGWLYDNLLRLAEAVGAIRTHNPENQHQNRPSEHNIEEIIGKLDHLFAVRLRFPNPYAGEVGLLTTRGIISYRTLQAIYQAWRVVTLCRSPRVLEIGPGLGRTAFFLNQFGVSDYVGIDIPLSNVAASHFLASSIGEDAVSLYGEGALGFQITPSHSLDDVEGAFDVIINTDSLTEMSRANARSYWNFAKERCRIFLSINHEANPFTFRDIYTEDGPLKVERHSYWMRRGYVEEVSWFKASRRAENMTMNL